VEVSCIHHHIVVLKWQNHLKVGTDKPKLKVKMQSVSDDDVRKRLLEKPHFELAAKGVCIQTGKMLHLLAGHSRSSVLVSACYCLLVLIKHTVLILRAILF